jgi:hypothetical protein
MAPPITSFIGRDAAGFCLYSPIQENQRFLGITHAHLGTRVIDNTIFLPSLPDMASKASRFSEVGDTPFLLIHRLNSAFADGRHALWRR